MPVSQPAPFVAAVIVNYRKAARIVTGLQSLRSQSIAGQIRISVVDNSVSGDEAATLRDAILPEEALAVPTHNLGYSRAVNIGVRNASRCDYILLVNPDIVLDSAQTVESMVALMQANPSIAVLATLQHNDDGSVVEVSRRFPGLWRQLARRIAPSRYSELHLMDTAGPQAQLFDVDWVQSSFVMIPRSFWDDVGGLDERYFVFMSDVEICRQAHKRNLRVAVASSLDVRADGLRASGGGLTTFFRNKALRIHLRDALVYHLRRAIDRTTGKKGG